MDTISDTLFSMEQYTLPNEPTPGGMSESCDEGSITEQVFALECMRRGYEVFWPANHSTTVDLIIRANAGPPVMIQVKKASYQKPRTSGAQDAWKVMHGSGKPSSAANPNDYGKRYRRYVRGDFDVLAAYISERNSFWFAGIDDVVQTSCGRWRAGLVENNWSVIDAMAAA